MNLHCISKTLTCLLRVCDRHLPSALRRVNPLGVGANGGEDRRQPRVRPERLLDAQLCGIEFEFCFRFPVLLYRVRWGAPQCAALERDVL